MPLPLPLFCWIFRGARRLGAPSRSFPDFAAKDRSFFSRTWSRAASSFAHGGKGTKTPPGFAPRSTVPVLQVAAPRTPLRGTRFWLVRAEVPARKIRIACVRFFPGPLGPWVGKICFRCGSRAAPGFAEPTLPVRILAAKARTPEENENRPEPAKAQGESNDPWFHLNLYQRYTLDPRNVGRRRAIACPRSRGPSRRAFVGFAPAIPSLKHPARGTVLCRRFWTCNSL